MLRSSPMSAREVGRGGTCTTRLARASRMCGTVLGSTTNSTSMRGGSIASR